MSAASFTGIPLGAFDFYARLETNNTKAWWQDHKGEYEQLVRDPLRALLTELEGEFGAWSMFRPYRDTRFSKDKTPLKTHQGGTVTIEDSVGYYVQVSAAGLMVAGGWYAPQGRQTERYRHAVDGPRGAELERMLAKLRRTWDIEGDPLKTRPRGFDADHPRIELLRFRQLTVAKHYDVEPWMATTKLLTKVRADWRTITPLLDWLADHVGPAGEPDLGRD